MNSMNATTKRKISTWLKALNTSHAPGQPPKSAIIVVLMVLVLYVVALVVITSTLK